MVPEPGPLPLPKPVEGRSRRILRYSRAVRWMKIVLPVVAVGLVGAIFLSGRENGSATGLLTPQEMARLAAGLALDHPRFAGQTADGNPYILRATAARPESAAPDRIRLDAPEGELTLGDGRRLTGHAGDGMLLRAEDRLRLWGGVRIESSDGYTFESERLVLVFSERKLSSPGPVVGEGPAGRIEAGNMVIDGGEAGAEAARFFFDRRVRVVFIPRTSRDGGQRRAQGTEPDG